MRRPEQLFLSEMETAASRIIAIVGDDLNAAALRNDLIRLEALLWNYTVLGEAAAKLPEGYKLQHPEIPWHRAIGLRNRIVHGYWSIDLEILVATARNDLPGLLQQLSELLSVLRADR